MYNTLSNNDLNRVLSSPKISSKRKYILKTKKFKKYIAREKIFGNSSKIFLLTLSLGSLHFYDVCTLEGEAIQYVWLFR